MRGLIASALLLLPAAAWAQNPMFDSVNGVRSVIHADPTGVNDSAPAINAALAADAQGNFHNVYLPAGLYKLKGPITISANRNAAGNLTGQCLFSDNKTQATLFISQDYSPTAGSPVKMTGNAYGTPCLKDINISFDNGFGGTRATAAALPNCGRPANVECKYPAAIDLTNANNASIQDVWIGGAWDCIHAAWTMSNGLTELRNVTCGAYDRGLDLSGSVGIINVTNYHFFPWGIGTQSIYLDGGTYAAYLTNDQGLTAHNFFSQNGRVSINGSAQPAFSQFVNLQMDASNGTFEVNSNSTFITIAGGYFTGSSSGSNTACQIQMAGGSNVQASAIQFRPDTSSNAGVLCNTGGFLQVSNSELVPQGVNATAISLTGGSTLLTGNRIETLASTWTVPLIQQTAGDLTATGNQIGTFGSGTALSLADSALNNVTGNTFGANWTFKPPGPQGSYVGTTWATYTPIVTCSTGALTAYTASGNYQRVGKQVQLNGQVTFTTLGTCAGNIILTEPVTALSGNFIGYGRESGVTGTGVMALVSGGALFLTKFDGTSIATAGYSPTFSVNYVAQ